MPSPFPGMNPYLEHPDLWPGIHGRIIVAIADFLAPQLRPKYFVAIEERVYQTNDDNRLLVGIPDVVVKRQSSEINPQNYTVAVATPTTKPKAVTVPLPIAVKERYLEVRNVETKEVVTVIEIISPKNKRTGEGRNAYDNKRQRVLGSATNLVEIDLLRTGEAMLVFGDDIQSDYRILISRAQNRPQADLYAFNLQDVIPSFPLPLKTEENEPLIKLQNLLTEIYDRGSYDLVIDYNQAPFPPLSEADAAWANEMLQTKGLRTIAHSPEIPN
ncbi:DUF4058 family protein [Nostoc spongiaeforme FACHB-130]|uniref:DUF4058 family protein n=1 Tax=Nostoc spongiaeforme FACHB-130 TaxID=1357510 RepID=A0ABR8FQS3_9NOSO|nr:DUF4058 family protein [Nostoc spongiaeforme]MBD2593752.1 DUF4058 family protein [Nostoc spongiaeforme FACHB-130]